MKLLPLAFTSLAATQLATATVVNIDFNTSGSDTYAGLGAVLDDPGGATAHWNPGTYVSGSGSSLVLADLLDSQLGNTGIGFEVNGLEGVLTSSATNAEQEISGGYLNLMRDYLRIDTGSTSNGVIVSTTGKFTGLSVGATYDLYFYGQGNNFGGGLVSGGSITQGQNSLFTIGSTSAQTGWDDEVGGDGELAEGIEYVKITAVADINGEIVFGWANVVQGETGNLEEDELDAAPSNASSGTLSSRYGALNGIQLVAVVPEPSSALLGVFGMLGLLVRRRR